ncbi:Glucose/ribitol dehydrogenase [Penicillium riverlandense]|uniref:Glucose/ribitol dehydrogenase n=1 Tax=Penicillium riverlandense TaxID=1903569 RepID=UPI0025486662|nr:Glucose/ribitol dehydrogenase [Penicillium riverlandense]KAJ5833634.1 Glucose/ribitol dehydrogenase [Penicillium riverlandense]
MAPFPSPTSTWHTESYPSISPTRPELSAKGKTVLVTGGGTGIGAETALSFAVAGASRIALLGRREPPLIATKASIEEKFAHVEVFVASTDVTDKRQVNSAFAEFASGGKIDILVSGAATIGPQDPVRDVDSEKFLDAIQQNLRGSLHVAQAFLLHASPHAVAIDINSSAAHVNFGIGFSAYNVAKLAVFRLWDSLAAGNPNLSIFHIQPGIVDTDMNKEAGGVKATGIEDHVSLPANFNVWLASQEAQFLKGKFLWANWDVDELKAKAEEIESSGLLSIGLGGWPFQDANWSATWKT